MAAEGIRIPFGIADPTGERIYVRGETGRLVSLDGRTGAVIAESELAADPLRLADSDLVAWTAPTERTPGEIVLVDARDDLRVRWRIPLLDPKTHHAVAAGLDEVQAAVEFERDVVVVTADIRASYHGGAPPPDDIIEAATVNDRRVMRLDRSTGTLLEFHTQVLPRVAAGETVSSDAEPVGIRHGPAGHGWQLYDSRTGEPKGEVELDAGTDAAAVVAGQVLYRVTEMVASSGSRRRYLRSRDLQTGATKWSRLIEEVEPRLPPPPSP